MTEFAVKTHQLRGYATQLAGVGRELEAISTRLGALQLGHVLQIRASQTLIGRVNDCRRAVGHQADDLGALSQGLDLIAGLYDATERTLSTPGLIPITPPPIPTGPTTGIGTPWEWLDGTADTLTGFGQWVTDLMGEESGAFSVLGALFDFAAGDVVDGFGSLFGTASRTIRAVFDFTNGGTYADWGSRLLGLHTNTGHGWGNAWNNFLGDLGFGNGPRNGWSTTATICQWTGYALSFVSSGFENYEEFDGDMGNARFWGETMLEGAVDVGLGIGAGVAAAALLPATWPAIAVGAVGAGVVWGANEVCEWITGGRDIGEVISDTVCDGVEVVCEGVENVGRAISDGVDTVCDWFGSLW